MRQPDSKDRTPEALELEAKQSELRALEERLVQRELDAATLRTELESFRASYLRIVGARYREIDRLKAQLARAEVHDHLKDPALDQDKHEPIAHAHSPDRKIDPDIEAGFSRLRSRGDDPAEFGPSERLKMRYRDVAKAIHPDLATDDSERSLRTKLMAEANRAYASGDEAGLENILADWKTNPDAFKGDGIAADLVRVIRRIAQVKRRLVAIETEIEELQRTDLFELQTQVKSAQAEGRDLLGELAAELDREIIQLQSRSRQEPRY